MNNLHTHNFCKGCSKGNKIKKQNLKFAEFLDGSDLVRKRQILRFLANNHKM